MSRSEPGQNRKIAALRIFRTCRKPSPTFFYINVPFLEMREAPQKQSKIVSQAIYSEEIDMLDEQDDWSKIRTCDGYTGWVEASDGAFISKVEEPECSHVVRVCRSAVHIYHVPDTEWGPLITLPLGSCFALCDRVNERWLHVMLLDGRAAYVQAGDVEVDPDNKSLQQMVDFALTLPPLPYTWGGRSSIYGFDCSGLVQMLYRQMGVFLPRDARDQIRWDGFVEVALDKLNRGDLIFFGSDSNNIGHVGLSLGGDEFLHASPRENKPWIRRSRLCDAAWCGASVPSASFRAGRTLR